MSNLAHGSMRIRGREENMIRFLRNELKATYEDIRPVSSCMCDVRREDRPVQIQVFGNRIRIIRDSDTRMGFHFMAENYGQFLHAFDRECSFTAPMVNGYEGVKLILLDRFSARYETIDTEWLQKKAREYQIDIRVFLSEFESGIPDDTICSYTFLHGMDDVIIKEYSPQDQLWHFPDKRMMYTAEKGKKQRIRDRIGG